MYVLITGNVTEKHNGNKMYYYDVKRNDGVIGPAVILTKEEYVTAVSALVDDFEVGIVESVAPMINYYETGFYLRVEDELRLVELSANYYKVRITKDSLSVSRITKCDYYDFVSKVDGFNIYHDVININGEPKAVFSYYLTKLVEDVATTTVIDEGFYVEMEDEELSTFKWVRNFGVVHDN